MVSLRARLSAIPLNRLIRFLDFDDTLTPIVSRPNRARLSRTARETLRKLVGLLPIGVISGRASKDLRRRVGLQNPKTIHSVLDWLATRQQMGETDPK